MNLSCKHISISKLFFLSITALLFHATSYSQTPKVVSGTIVRIDKFHSKYVTDRNIDIWLPEGYPDSSLYPVLYMHDGQMLFDSSITWNHQAWDVDDVTSGLMSENKIRKCIVVGIWSDGTTRHADYFPEQPFNSLDKKDKDTVTAQLQRSGRTINQFKPQSENYLKFIVKELMPYMRKNYAIAKGKQNTFIAGSSMGGLISLYAICCYPNVFGGAACLSTHWTGTFTDVNNPIPNSFLHYMRRHLPDPQSHILYFDCGDQTLDALYPSIQQKADKILVEKGYNETNWKTVYVPGADHSEKSWKKRLDIPLTFLLGEKQK